jgi:hypothetical protein
MAHIMVYRAENGSKHPWPPPISLDAPTITLTPPDPVPVVAPAQAAGLVPLSGEQTSKLDQKVDAFIADLVAQDAPAPNSASAWTS